MAEDFEKKTQERLIRLEARANACETLLVQVMRELPPEQRRSVLIRAMAEIERQQKVSEERGFKLAGKELVTAANRLLRQFRPGGAVPQNAKQPPGTDEARQTGTVEPI